MQSLDRKREPGSRATSVATLASRLIETVDGVQGTHREFRIGSIDQYRELDLRGGDRPDVDALVGERLEGDRGDAGMAAHADPDGRDFRHIASALQRSI